MKENIAQRDFEFLVKNVFIPLGYDYSRLDEEKEGQEYGACIYSLNGLAIKSRTAKITPKKVGQFVTLWKRNSKEITEPHDESDLFDFYVINVRNNKKFGQFIFPKSILSKQGILTTAKKDGKRGFRVYPSWDKAINKQAVKTQSWQLKFFTEISSPSTLEILQRLYKITLGK